MATTYADELTREQQAQRDEVAKAHTTDEKFYREEQEKTRKATAIAHERDQILARLNRLTGIFPVDAAAQAEGARQAAALFEAAQARFKASTEYVQLVDLRRAIGLTEKSILTLEAESKRLESTIDLALRDGQVLEPAELELATAQARLGILRERLARQRTACAQAQQKAERAVKAVPVEAKREAVRQALDGLKEAGDKLLQVVGKLPQLREYQLFASMYDWVAGPEAEFHLSVFARLPAD